MICKVKLNILNVLFRFCAMMVNRHIKKTEKYIRCEGMIIDLAEEIIHDKN